MHPRDEFKRELNRTIDEHGPQAALDGMNCPTCDANGYRVGIGGRRVPCVCLYSEPRLMQAKARYTEWPKQNRWRL